MLHRSNKLVGDDLHSPILDSRIINAVAYGFTTFHLLSVDVGNTTLAFHATWLLAPSQRLESTIAEIGSGAAAAAIHGIHSIVT